MLEKIIDISPEVDVPDSEFKRLLGYPPGHEAGERVKELMESTKRWYAENGKPWVYARQAESLELISDGVRIEDGEFHSSRLRAQLDDARSDGVFLVAVSAGRNCEERARQFWDQEKPDEYFFTEVYGSAVVENLVTNLGARFCEWADGCGKAILPHYSPGYPGWEISDQRQLLELLRQRNGRDFPGEINVLESGMLQPKKSLLAVFGITSHTEAVQRLTSLNPCGNCSFHPCRYRRTPYRNSIPQLEDVRNLQGQPQNNGSSAVRPAVNYLTNPRALRKWSEERLHLSVLDDRSVEARFRYEGTTCSNMGRTLEFDYHIKLVPTVESYTIVDVRCEPAPGDAGHTLMCQYLENPRRLMSEIAAERPLVGKRLDDVLTWKREYNPSGCYCSSEGREYKWGLVFEVLHYALTRQNKLA